MTRLLPALAALAALLGAAAPPALAQTRAGAVAADAFSPAAFVDGRAVTRFDVDQRARLLLFVRATPEMDLDAGLDSMIDDRLKRRAAEDAGLSLPREEVDAALGRFAQAQGAAGPQQLESRLRAAGIALSAVTEFIETEVLWTTLIRRDFGMTVEVGDLELDDEIEAAGFARRVSFDLGEIAVASGADSASTRARVEAIADRLRGGADFAAEARANSASPSARAGGRVGWVPRDQLPPGLGDTLAALPVGGITEPFEVPGGFVILGVLDRREEAREITADDREQLRMQLLERRLARRADGRLQELRARAYVEYR